MKNAWFAFAVIVFAASCTNAENKSTAASAVDTTIQTDDHPEWIDQGNIYEVNVRQYTPEGTFAAFEKHLPRLKEMGVQTLWFMPITPISQTDRKGKLGSYYAVADYTAVNPEFGTMDDWKQLVKKAHDMGFKVITDWVPNHSGGDNRWLKDHPDFYKKDSTGKVISPFDWTDTRKLNYENAELRDSMIAAMKFWLKESDIDGFRCDVASEVPASFWKQCIHELRSIKKVFMLAEADNDWMHKAGFDATYAWSDFAVMKQIAKGTLPATAFDSVVRKNDSTLTPGAMRLYFTSNHDENSWNKADYGTMPGAIHAPFAVLTQTMKRSVPLIYSGQEEPFLDSISFFYKDTITFGKFQRAAFYKTLLQLRKEHAALSADASFKKLRTNNDAAMYCFERENNGDKVLVVLNLSNKAQNFTWTDKPSQSEWNNIFLGRREPADKGFGIEPWGYAVYVK